MLPSGWRKFLLEDVAEVKIGGTPSRNKQAFWLGSDTSDAYPWVSISDLNQDPVFFTKETITALGVKSSNVKLVKAGTVMMSFKLTIGRIARAGIDLYTNEAIASFIPIEHKVLNDYLYYVLPKAACTGDIDQAVKGKTLNKSKMLKLELVLPPLAEQKKIAEILGSVDEAIEATKTVIEQTKKVKQGLLQELLTRGIGHTTFKPSPLGDIPESWEDTSIGEVCDVKRGASPRPISSPVWFSDVGPGWVRISDVTRSNLFLERTEQCLSNRGVEKSVSISPGDLIMSICATIGRPVISKINACIHDGFVKFDRLSSNVNKLFMLYFLQRASYFFECSGQLGTQKNINTAIVKGYALPLPPLPEQEKIASILESVDNQITAENDKLASLEATKKGLMQDLLTGKVRVKVETIDEHQERAA